MSTLKVNTITPISGSTVSVSGSLAVTGKVIVGDSTNDTIVLTAEISSSIIPDASNTYDLGSPTKVWKEIYVSSESLNFVDGAGSSSKFTKENVDDLKSGKSPATIGGFNTSTRAKAIFQDDDETTYKKMTVPGRVSQFISGTLVKDYNLSGSNSYSTKQNIQNYEWNGADSMSFNSTHSFWNVENMSMDITEGGFYGLAVSGSTLASNLHNMANNTSGLFLTGSNVIVSGSTSLSGSTTFEGGDTTISQSISDTLNVSGGNVVISSSLVQQGETTFIIGESSESISSQESASAPGGLIVSSAPGTLGSSSLDGTIIADTVVSVPTFPNRAIVTSSLTLTVAQHGNGKTVLIRSGGIPRDGIETSLNYPPNSVWYGLPSYPMPLPHLGIDGTGSHTAAGMYSLHQNNGPAGTIRLELPSASVGENFNLQSKQHSFNGYFTPNILVTPNGSNTFQHTIAGGQGVQGKGVILPSGSQFIRSIQIWCMSEATWSFANIDGAWQDEA